MTPLSYEALATLKRHGKPATGAGIAELMGRSPELIQRHMRTLWRAELVHIVDWVAGSPGAPAPIYAAGHGVSVPRPESAREYSGQTREEYLRSPRNPIFRSPRNPGTRTSKKRPIDSVDRITARVLGYSFDEKAGRYVRDQITGSA